MIVTGRGKRAIEDHFDAAFELEYYLAHRQKHEELLQIQSISDLATIYYVRQKEPLGLGHAVRCARSFVGDEPFAVLLGDDVISAPVPCVRQLLEVFSRYGGPVVAVERVEYERIKEYGIIAGRRVAPRVWEITDLAEKPRPEDAPSNLAIVGRYVLTPDIFSALTDAALDSRDEIQLTDALRVLGERRVIYAVEFEGHRYDTGNKLGFLKATVEFALLRQGLGQEFRAYLKSLDL